jgi:hypothetical protein
VALDAEENKNAKNQGQQQGMFDTMVLYIFCTSYNFSFSLLFSDHPVHTALYWQYE